MIAKKGITDFKKLGFNSRHLFLVKADDTNKDQVKSFLLQHNSVNNVYVTNSDFDFLFEGIFKTDREMLSFKKDLERQNYILMTRHHELIENVARGKWGCSR